VLTADAVEPARVVALATAPGDIVSTGAIDRIVSVSVLAWMAGVVLLSIRLIVSYIGIEGLRRATLDVDKTVLLRLEALARRLGVTRTVRVFASDVVRVPAVVGTLRPVILLPVGVITGLPAAHLDAVLAHELAHVRRHDYLVNGLQAMVETLLFYHPAVWWCTRQIRIEREHCCDDLVVKACGDRVAYATALAQLEELRGLEPMLSLNATGGRLIDRIRRLLDSAPVNEHGSSAWIVIAGLTVTVVAAITMPALTLARADDGRTILQDDVTLQEPPAPPVPPAAPGPPHAPLPPVAARPSVHGVPDAPPVPPAPPEAPIVPAPPAFSVSSLTPVPPLPPAPPLIPAPPVPLADPIFAPPAPPAPPLPSVDGTQIDPDVIAREMQRASEQLTRGFEDLRRATEEVNAKQEALHQAQAELGKMQLETVARNTQIEAIRAAMAELSAAMASSRLNQLKEEALRKEIEAIRQQMEKLRAR
jgi:bla regulator protein blaR1